MVTWFLAQLGDDLLCSEDAQLMGTEVDHVMVLSQKVMGTKVEEILMQTYVELTTMKIPQFDACPTTRGFFLS